MDYEKLWNKLKNHTSSCKSISKDQLLEKMGSLEKEIENNQNRTNLENNRLFEKSETGTYNPKPF